MADLMLFKTMSREVGLVFLTGSFFGNNAVSPDPLLFDGDWFTAVTRTAVGEYTVQLRYKFPKVLTTTVFAFTTTPASGITCQLYKTAPALNINSIFSTAGAFQVVTLNGVGTQVDITSATQIHMNFGVQNSTV